MPREITVISKGGKRFVVRFEFSKGKSSFWRGDDDYLWVVRVDKIDLTTNTISAEWVFA